MQLKALPRTFYRAGRLQPTELSAEAKDAEVLAANLVEGLTKGKDFLFTDRGEAALKGFEGPVRLHEVWWRDEG